MKINPIQCNYNKSINNSYKGPSFGMVYSHPAQDVLRTFRNNLPEEALPKMQIFFRKYSNVENWDVIVSGLNGKLLYEADSKDKNKNLKFLIIGIKPIKNENIEQTGEFEATARCWNINKTCKNLKFKFSDPNDAVEAFNKLQENYQKSNEIVMDTDFNSNLERIRIADENFSIIKNAQVTEIANPADKT